VPESLLPGEERKRVTVLFADLAGSTGLGEQLDPEQLREVMDPFFQKMRAELEAEGGTVEKFIGDAVMAVFGVPVVHEDDATRALRAALRMRRALDRLNRSLEESHGIRLAIRTGVNTGEVVARTVPRQGQGLVTGDAVNVAARLEQRAESGQILVGERTARAARGLRLEPIGPLTLKGKEEPVVAYEVLDEEVTAPGSGRRSEPGRYRAPLVGRREELGVLKSVFERSVIERRSHLVTVFGDAGVGKSRLVEEFEAWAQALPEPALAIGGRCLPYGEGVTYWPLAQILKRWAGVLDSDEPETALDRLRQAVGKLLAGVPDVDAEPEELTAALAFTVGLRDPARPVVEDPREARAATHEAWRIFLSSLASPRPVVAVIEDIHWADPALLELLQELAEHSEGPLMFVCPARPELTVRRPDWGGGRWNYSSLLLEPLSKGDAGDLLDLLLVDAAEVPGSLRARILERAGGNPFFLEEIVLHLMEEHPGPEIEDVQIPDTVQGVLAARMDLLPPSEKRVLQTASVVGRTFWNGAVASILDGEDPPQDLDDILWRLEDRGLVHARIGSTIVGEREFSFRHILTQEVAYESLPRRERATAHARVAGWIERQAAEREREFAELLAHHYEEAYRGVLETSRPGETDRERLRERAFHHAMLAANEALRKLALEQAERFAATALSVADGTREHVDALEALGMTYFHDYRGDIAWDHLKEAIDLRAGSSDDLGEESSHSLAHLCAAALEIVTRARGTMRHRIMREEAERYLAIGLAAAGEGDDEDRVRLLVAASFFPFAFKEVRLNDEDLEPARRAGEEAAVMADRLGRVDLRSAALDGISSLHQSIGRYGAMGDAIARRLELVPKLTDPYEIGDIHAMASWWALNTGRYREAAGFADRGVREAQAGSPAQGLYCLDFRTAAHFRLGDWEATLADVAVAEEVLGDRRETPPGFAPQYLVIAAFIHDARGEGAMADRYLRLVGWLEAVEDRAETILALWRSRLLARQGRHEEARALLERPGIADDQRGRDEVLEAWCEVVAEEGAWGDAPAIVEQARSHAAWAGVPPLELYAGRLQGRLTAATGDGERAADLLRIAADGFADLEAEWEAAITRLELATVEASLGRATEARDRYGDVIPVFERLRSLRELDRASGLLARLT
jgi:class 3 adenylate cyclase